MLNLRIASRPLSSRALLSTRSVGANLHRSRLINSCRSTRTLQTTSFRRFPSSAPVAPTPKKAPSPTTLFYRQLVPSMLHCIALGSIVYYALELLHNTLDGELIVEELSLQVEMLEGELNLLKKGVEGSTTQSSEVKKGWFW